MKKQIEIDNNTKGQRLDKFLLSSLGEYTRSYIKTLIENEKVNVNGNCVKSGYNLKMGDMVEVVVPEPEPADILPENIPLNIVYEDEYLAVIDKPKNMVVHPAGSLRTGTLVNALMHHFKNLSTINGEFRPGIVHRLDKDTSGLIVVAKDNKAHLELQKQIQNKTCHRVYQAICYGKFSKDEGTIENYLARGKREHEKIFVVPQGQGRIAITNYKVLAYNQGFSYVEFELKTGRTHQIRVHSSHMGHPIVGDKLYGRKGEKWNLDGQLLHAVKLIFTHPVTHKIMEFDSTLPQKFEEFLQLKNLV